jgi:5'-nucleotidase
VLPFQNTIATFQIAGADLVQALENGVSKVEEGAGRFVQVAGMKYSYDGTKPAGSRISDVQVKDGDNWGLIDPAKIYTVATNNYVRGGGDGFKIFAEKAANAYDFGPGLEQTVADYLTANRPYKPYTDGRITVTAEAPKPAPAEAAAPAAPAPAAPATPPPPAGSNEIANTPPVIAPAPAPTAPVEPAPAPAAPAEAAAPAPTAGDHVIVRGDTLWDLAVKAYGDGRKWTVIRDANPGVVPKDLLIGSTLKIPAA